MSGLEELGSDQASQWLEVTWYLFLLLFHRREQEEYTELEPLVSERARRSKFRLKEEVEQLGKTMAQLVEERGRVQGREEGREEGRAEGRTLGLRGALEMTLGTRFGEVPPEVLVALATADLDTLDGWFRRALTVPTLADVGIAPQEPPR
jgi:hypothetical protein